MQSQRARGREDERLSRPLPWADFDTRSERCEHPRVRACPSCSKRIPDQVAVCAFCGARQPGEDDDAASTADTLPAPTRETITDTLSDTVQTRRRPPPGTPGLGAPGRPRLPSMLGPQATPGLVVMGEGVGGGTRWFRVVLIAVALCVVGAAVAILMRPGPFPMNALTPVGADEAVVCRARPTCVVVYLAPWSDASNAAIPMVERLRDRWRDDDRVGLAIVVGHDSPERVERFATALGENTWADTDDLAFRALKLEMAPSWFTLDATGRVRKRIEGTFFPIELLLLKLDAERG